ncbi:MAG: ribosome recycling factor [candidate division Zixibacteria bacterium]|nr:ribosome recycling factor [candidate division Zixibacteria bacterium]
MINQIIKSTEDRLKKSAEAVRQQMASIRSGKASTSLLDGIKVEYYGTQTPLNQVATISAPEPRLIIIQPWEKTIVDEINKAIQASNLGLNPQVDGQIIRIPIPPLSEERRKELAKHVKDMAENGKVAMRNVRRDANDELKKAEKDKKVSEDQMHDGLKKVQDLLDKYTGIVDEIMQAKEKELMEV